MTLTQSLITRNTHAPLCVTRWQQQWPLSLESDSTVSTLASSGSVEAVLDSPRPLMTFFGFAEKDLSLWSGFFIGWLFFWLKIAGVRLQSGRSSPPTAETPKRHFSSCFSSLEHFYLMVLERAAVQWLLIDCYTTRFNSYSFFQSCCQVDLNFFILLWLWHLSTLRQA